MTYDLRPDPYFAAPARNGNSVRRVLLISYFFPPHSAIGGLRWEQMARYLAAHGWQFDVIARDFTGLPGLDPARLQRLPPGTRIFSVADREPLLGRLQRRLLPFLRPLLDRASNVERRDTLTKTEISEQAGGRAIVRAYLAWLEYERDGNWAHDAARMGRRLADETRYDFIITSGPPHMAHDAGRHLSEERGIPLVVDMRDPWSFVQRFVESVASPVWVRLAQRYERRAVRQAALVTMNTEASRDAMRGLYPEYARKVEAIRNGCDDEPLPQPHDDARFTIRFAGSIYADRDPRLFFRAVAQVVRELSLDPKDFGVEFVGDVDRFSGMSTSGIAAEEGIGDFVRLRGLVPRSEALQFLADATMLLSLPQDSDYSVPAKIYEYLRFNAWMLVLGPPESATALLLRGTEADVVDSSDVAAMARVIRTRYEQFRAGQRPRPIGRDGRFDRSVQAKRFLELAGSLPATP